MQQTQRIQKLQKTTALQLH